MTAAGDQRTSVPRLLGAAVLFVGPTALAFFSGGFYDIPRLWAALMALALLAACVVGFSRPLPQARPALVAVGGLALLAAVTTLSVLWAPSTDPAFDDAQRMLLYLAYFVAGAALLKPRRLARVVEPTVAFGGLVVLGYGLSERLLPGLLEFTRGAASAGRLEQPLTYWNAMGALGALSVVAAARIAGDRERSGWLRMAAAAGAAPLGLGVYLSFSRGALGAVAVGLVVLLILAPTREQLRGVGLALGAAVAAGLIAAPLDGLTELKAPLDARRTDGAVMLAGLVLVSLLAAGAELVVSRAEGRGRLSLGDLRLPRWTLQAGIAAVIAMAAVTFMAASGQQIDKGAGAARLASVESNRYSYWDVAVRAFAGHPLAGVGSGGFTVEWMRERDVPEFVRDAHSLYLETLAELGLLGAIALGAFLAGLAVCAARAQRADPILATGANALLATWAFACALDWHWEMPAVTLLALLAAAVVLGAASPVRPAA